MTDWRSIESAPKDGQIMLWADYHAIGFWSDFFKNWQTLDGDGTRQIEPTHWQPLPEPPRVT